MDSAFEKPSPCYERIQGFRPKKSIRLSKTEPLAQDQKSGGIQGIIPEETTGIQYVMSEEATGI